MMKEIQKKAKKNSLKGKKKKSRNFKQHIVE